MGVTGRSRRVSVDVHGQYVHPSREGCSPARTTYIREAGVDIVVKGRNVEVPDHYRAHIAEKLQRMERFDQKIIEVNVELSHERNRRQADHCQRVEITLVSRGPVIRGEACSADF